jgi:heat shock protein HslJ/membrane-bound inhibitor of C-type lysozyme
MKSYLPYIGAVIVLVLVAGIVYLLLNREVPPSVDVTSYEQSLFTEASVLTYDAADGASLKAELVGDLARITGLGYDQVILRQVPAASGAKYEGGNGLVFHTKGNEARLETPQTVIFTGQERIMTPAEEPPILPPVTDGEIATSTESVDIVGEWILQSTTLTDFTPKTPSDFGLTFGADGTIGGDTDCNSFGGQYTLTDRTLTFGSLAQTEMYCEGSLENVFTGFFSSNVEVSYSPDMELLFTNQFGDTITLVRQ